MSIEVILIIFALIIALDVVVERLPRENPLRRAMTSRWGVRPAQRYARLRRQDLYVPLVLSTLSGILLLLVSGSVIWFADAVLGLRHILHPWLMGLGFGTSLLGFVAFSAFVLILWRLGFWRADPELPLVVRAAGVIVAEADVLSDQSEKGFIVGAARPYPEFSRLENDVVALSETLAEGSLRSPKLLARELSDKWSLSLELRGGPPVPALSVSLVDLEILGEGRGFAFEAELRDFREWRRFRADHELMVD